jgi:uncharacterized protein with FMN-binding domain
VARANNGNKGNKKVANGLVAMSSAAVLAVYAAGYVRTRSAADRFTLPPADRRPAVDGRAAAVDPNIQLQPDSDPGAVPLQPAGVGTTAETVRLKPDGTNAETTGAAVRVKPATTNAETTTDTTVRLKPDTTKTDTTKTDTTKTDATKTDTTKTDATVRLKPDTTTVDTMTTAAAPEPPAKPGYKDGTYLGWGHCRHGDIQASVVILGGKIASATISDCETRYPCSMIAALPPQVAQRQAPDVDTISGATQSGDAFYYAVLDALFQAK